MIAADLVVDASGRGALSLGVFNALGWQPPKLTEIGVDISYSSTVVEIPAAAPPDWKLAVTSPDPPHLALSWIDEPVGQKAGLCPRGVRGGASSAVGRDGCAAAICRQRSPIHTCHRS
jgi:hypothetical protein